MNPVEEDKRSKIIETAQKQFTKFGFHETKLDTIAKEADVGKGTLYLYFKSKEDLFFSCILDSNEKWLEDLKQIINKKQPFHEALKQIADSQIKALEYNFELIHQFMQNKNNFPKTNPSVQKIKNHIYSTIECASVFFQSAIDKGILANILSAKQMAIIFQQIFHINLQCKIFDINTISAQEWYSILIKIFSNSDVSTQ